MQTSTAVHSHPAPVQAGHSHARPSRAKSAPQWDPICCKQDMQELVRRAILQADGKVIFCAVWHCLNCGRLLL